MESDILLNVPAGAAASAANQSAEDAAGGDAFAQAVLEGLARESRSIACRFLYDARGSELFEAITKLEEYYPTRVETALLEAYGEEIAALAGPGASWSSSARGRAARPACC